MAVAQAYLLPVFCLASIFTGLEEIPWFRASVLERLFPDPPRFVRGDLDEAREATMTGLEKPALRFIGRSEALEQLKAFSSAKGPEFRWLAILGVSGIGKTRLAIEWLAAQKTKGWDVGIVDPNDYAQLEGWKARRPTALLIDDPTKNWGERLGDALFHLSAAARPGRSVHVLLTDQTIPWIVCSEGKRREQVMKGEVSRPLRLAGLNSDELEMFRVEAPKTVGISESDVGDNAALDAATLHRETGGRPRAVLLMLRAKSTEPSYATALKEWADKFLPELADEDTPVHSDLIIPLAMAALAGPLPTRIVHGICHNIDPIALGRYFEKANAEKLSETIPALEPDDLAEEILMLALVRLDEENLQKLAAAAIAANPSAVELHLGSLWMRHTEAGVSESKNARVDQLMALQMCFDRLAPERVAAFVQNVGACLDATRIAPVGATDAFVELENLVARRPFDPAIRLLEARGAVNAINNYGTTHRWDELERWGHRLSGLADDMRFSDNSEIRLEEADCAVNAIAAYGTARHWDELERWGRRLTGLADDMRFSADPIIRLAEARGAVNAIDGYGAAQCWQELERWGRRLIGLVDDMRFSANPEIRLAEAIGAFNAIAHYGAAQVWDDLERWGHRLTGLADDMRFSANREIRLAEAKGVYNAMTHYGTALRWDELERWGRRLTGLADDMRFSANPKIRLQEASGAVNAMALYGTVQRWDEVERWGRRFTGVADDIRFSASPEIRFAEARGAANAIHVYGTAQRWEELERWGHRLTRLADDMRFSANPEIRFLEASGAVNAIAHYGRAQRWDELERWGRRLTGLAYDMRFSTNPDIRLEEAKGAFNAISHYGQAGDSARPAYGRWRMRLARLSLQCLANLAIQDIASKCGLSYVDQAIQGFPYGLPQPPERS